MDVNKEMKINCRLSTSHAPDAILHRYVTAEWSFACFYLCVCVWGGLRRNLLEPKLTLNYLADDDLELLTLPPPLSKCWNDQCMQAC